MNSEKKKKKKQPDLGKIFWLAFQPNLLIPDFTQSHELHAHTHTRREKSQYHCRENKDYLYHAYLRNMLLS